MKLILGLSILISSQSYARSHMDFNQAINDDLMREVRKDDEKFKKESFRKPASVVPEQEHVIQDTPKIDKNIRQIGPNKW